MTAKESILSAVGNGAKGVQVVTDVVILLQKEGIDIPDLPVLIDQMVKDRELVEVEYIVPCMSYRIKSFYLPAGSEIVSVKGCL